MCRVFPDKEELLPCIAYESLHVWSFCTGMRGTVGKDTFKKNEHCFAVKSQGFFFMLTMFGGKKSKSCFSIHGKAELQPDMVLLCTSYPASLPLWREQWLWVVYKLGEKSTFSIN